DPAAHDHHAGSQTFQLSKEPAEPFRVGLAISQSHESRRYPVGIVQAVEPLEIRVDFLSALRALVIDVFYRFEGVGIGGQLLVNELRRVSAWFHVLADFFKRRGSEFLLHPDHPDVTEKVIERRTP